jgi:hypothetical protein
MMGKGEKSEGRGIIKTDGRGEERGLTELLINR